MQCASLIDTLQKYDVLPHSHLFIKLREQYIALILNLVDMRESLVSSRVRNKRGGVFAITCLREADVFAFEAERV